MPDDTKHQISFDASAKEKLEVVSGLPDLESVSDDERLTDICMFFGAAAYYAQFFEASLSELLITYHRLADKAHLQSAIDSLDATLQKKTMGALLKDLRKLFTIDDTDIDALLDEALDKRNYLMHHFFRDRTPDFASELKRQQIFEELIHTGLTLKKAMFAVRGINAAIECYLNTDGEATS